MSVPLRPRKSAKARRRPRGRQRLLLDAQWWAEAGTWHVSMEYYLDDLAKDPDRIDVLGDGSSDLAIVTRVLECLQHLAKGTLPPLGMDTLDLRDPGRE